MKVHQLNSILTQFALHDPMADLVLSDTGHLLVTSEFLPPLLEDLDAVTIAGNGCFAVDVEALFVDATRIG